MTLARSFVAVVSRSHFLLTDMLLPLTILSVVCCVCAAQSCSNETCRLPHCACEIQGEHKLIARADIPQMVLFTFNDYVNDEVYDYYPRLFRPSSKNPNGCPISATFFVSHSDWWGRTTNYTMVTQLYRAGHEMGSHSDSHRTPPSWWEYTTSKELRNEMEGQRNQLAQYAGIPVTEIRGIRMPYLKLGGDRQFKMMADVGFQFDATFMSHGPTWPFTLDYPLSKLHCYGTNCPKGTHPGIWEVPLNFLTAVGGQKCIMIDICSPKNTNKADVLKYLWHNFNKSRNGNREPFGVNMHAQWFLVKHQLEAMQSFIADLVKLDDVYIVSVHQALEWMRSPCRLQDAIHFAPWKTSCRRITTEQATRTYPKWGWGIANQATATGSKQDRGTANQETSTNDTQLPPMVTLLFRVLLLVTCCALLYLMRLAVCARKLCVTLCYRNANHASHC